MNIGIIETTTLIEDVPNDVIRSVEALLFLNKAYLDVLEQPLKAPDKHRCPTNALNSVHLFIIEQLLRILGGRSKARAKCFWTSFLFI